MKTRPFNLLKSLVFTLCIAYPLSACSQSPRDYSGTATVKMYRQNVNDIITLKIPVGYLDHFVLAGPPVPGAPENKSPVRDTMYFEVDLPDLQARSAANNWKFEYPDSLTEKMSFKYHVRYFPPENERYGLWQDTLLSRLGMKHPDCFQRRMPGDRFGMEYHHIDSKTCHADAPSLRDDRFILRDA